ncbi:hypothetical protein [Flavobacterium cerinum]|uniref:Uncharacterized protein n=1 Tax=Flavobacterium cerinum TaxID=2502784 RepID=A0A444GLK0_9FLAO|nr:hypothetical protein [Flavobacterium cerinum]RWW91848.1 hypothetical protein EPI11_17555 [Flavobacterium cerinum]
MKEFYTKIISTLQSEQALEKFTEKFVPGVRMVDLYRGQYLYQTEFEQLILPAVLIEYSLNHQTNSATINLHCVWEQFYETDNKSADREKALQFFDWQDVVYDLVYQMESLNTGKLTLVSENTVQDETPVHVHILNFECSYMGRVKRADGNYNFVDLEEVSTTGTIKEKELPEFNIDL